MSRPKGSKNKKTLEKMGLMTNIEEVNEVVKKKRGRPVGFKVQKQYDEDGNEIKRERKSRKKKDVDALFVDAPSVDGLSKYDVLCTLRDFFAGINYCGIWRHIQNDVAKCVDSDEAHNIVKANWMEKARKALR